MDEDFPSTKRRKEKVKLYEEQEEDILNWYMGNEMFYNQSKREFKDRAKKDQMISEKAKEMHIAFEDLKGWLTSMQMMFGKLSRKKSGSATHPPTACQQWILDKFDFLSCHLILKTETRQLANVSLYIFIH